MKRVIGLQVGDVVVLKGRSEKMTIIKFTPYIVMCGWFTVSGEYWTAEFPITANVEYKECNCLEKVTINTHIDY